MLQVEDQALSRVLKTSKRWWLPVSVLAMISFLFATAMTTQAATRPVITSVSPSVIRAATSGTITITVTGQNFRRGAKVGLSLVAAKSVQVLSSTKLKVTVDRTRLTSRMYDLLVWNRDGGFSGRRKLLTVLPATDPSVYAVGDIAGCAYDTDTATADLLRNTTGTILTLGDTVYNSGTTSEFANCFHPVWGDLRDRIKPAPGNHDYTTANAEGYYSYFEAAAGNPTRGFYSYNVGTWHVVALNSNCAAIGGCGPGSAQFDWLVNDLAGHPAACTLAYLHHPPFSSALHGDQAATLPLWQALYDYGADVLLAGHDHDYERFSVMDRNGTLATSGLREFVVGTGGNTLYAFNQPHATSQARNNTAHGVLRLTLHPTSYDWAFLPVAGQSFTDTGHTACR